MHASIARSNPRRLLMLAAVLLIAGVCTGCNPAARLVGKWDADFSKLAKGNPLAAMAASAMKFRVEFRSDGTCTLNASILGQSTEQKGTWRYLRSEGKAIVIGVKMPETADERELQVNFTDDDHLSLPSLSEDSAEAPGAAMHFARVKS